MAKKLMHPSEEGYPGLADQLKRLTDLLIRQTQAIYNASEEIDENESILESKLFRFTLSNKSFIKLLLEPTEFICNRGQNPINSIDLNLLVSCVRQQIEVYSKLFHVCFDKVDDSEKEWRILIYQLQGLRKQDVLKSEASQPNHPKIKAMIDKTKSELDSIVLRIQGHQNYKGLSKERDQKKILKGAKAIHKEMSDILITSGLNRRYFLLWSVYSNYAHNEYVSDRQYESMSKDRSSFLAVLELLCKVLILLAVRLSILMNERFNSSKESFKNESNANLTLFDLWVDFLDITNSRVNDD